MFFSFRITRHYGCKAQCIEKYEINMNYVDRGSFGMDRAEKSPERGGPGVARVWACTMVLMKMKLKSTYEHANVTLA